MPTDLDLNKLREVWSDLSLTLEDLGQIFGRSGSTVSYHAKQIGLPRRPAGRRPLSGRCPVGDDAGDVALTGGRWVPNGRGVMVWVRDGG